MRTAWAAAALAARLPLEQLPIRALDRLALLAAWHRAAVRGVGGGVAGHAEERRKALRRLERRLVAAVAAEEAVVGRLARKSSRCAPQMPAADGFGASKRARAPLVVTRPSSMHSTSCSLLPQYRTALRSTATAAASLLNSKHWCPAGGDCPFCGWFCCAEGAATAAVAAAAARPVRMMRRSSRKTDTSRAPRLGSLE